MDRTGLARHMLDLQAEYARYDETEVRLAELGRAPERSRETIVGEYCDALDEFIGQR